MTLKVSCDKCDGIIEPSEAFASVSTIVFSQLGGNQLEQVEKHYHPSCCPIETSYPLVETDDDATPDES